MAAALSFEGSVTGALVRSDVKLAEALDDRASFRRFCGFSRNETTPERTACRVRTCLALSLPESACI